MKNSLILLAAISLSLSLSSARATTGAPAAIEVEKVAKSGSFLSAVQKCDAKVLMRTQKGDLAPGVRVVRAIGHVHAKDSMVTLILSENVTNPVRVIRNKTGIALPVDGQTNQFGASFDFDEGDESNRVLICHRKAT